MPFRQLLWEHLKLLWENYGQQASWERIEKLVDKVKELHNNNLARVEEEVLHMDKVKVPMNADKERVE